MIVRMEQVRKLERTGNAARRFASLATLCAIAFTALIAYLWTAHSANADIQWLQGFFVGVAAAPVLYPPLRRPAAGALFQRLAYYKERLALKLERLLEITEDDLRELPPEQRDYESIAS